MKTRNLFTIILALLAGTSLLAQDRAYTPTLVSPAHETTEAMPVTLLDWEPIAGYHNIRYEVQIDETNAFDSPIELQSVETAIYSPALKFNTTYYWRVRALDDDQNSPVSDWSEPWSYTTFRTVALNTPANNHNTEQSPRPFVKWKSTNSSNFNGISKFEIAYSVNEDMSDASYRIREYANSNNTAITITDTLFNLNFGQVYYWNVRAYNMGEGDYESVSDWCDAPYTFVVVDEPILSKPQMKNDKNVDVDPDVLMELKNEYLAVVYEYQIATDEAFENVVGTYPSTSKTCSAPSLAYGEKYYWRARHTNNNAFSEWSFTDEEVWWFSVISKPELKSPANNASLEANGNLTWSAIGTSTQYTIAISLSPDFPSNDTMTRVVTRDPQTTNIQTLNINSIGGIVNASNNTYYWRVKATHTRFDGVVEDTEWSDTRVFTYNPTGINDYNGFYSSVYPNPSNGSFTVEVDENVDNAIVTVYDMVGKVRFHDNVSFEGNRHEFNLSLEKGLYIIEINNNGIRTNKKITVQ